MTLLISAIFVVAALLIGFAYGYAHARVHWRAMTIEAIHMYGRACRDYNELWEARTPLIDRQVAYVDPETGERHTYRVDLERERIEA